MKIKDYRVIVKTLELSGREVYAYLNKNYGSYTGATFKTNCEIYTWQIDPSASDPGPPKLTAELKVDRSTAVAQFTLRFFSGWQRN